MNNADASIVRIGKATSPGQIQYRNWMLWLPWERTFKPQRPSPLCV